MTPPSDATDRELLAAARAGDNAALEALLERHQAQVYRFGMKMCRDPADAEDVLQETLLAMARGVRDFRGASSLSTWLYAVARSFCIKKRRRSRFAPVETSLDARGRGEGVAVADGTRPQDEMIADKEIERALEGAIRRLDPMYREVLLLRDVEGLTAPEVAEVLGITVQAVKSRLHRARVAVRDEMAPLLGTPSVSPSNRRERLDGASLKPDDEGASLKPGDEGASLKPGGDRDGTNLDTGAARGEPAVGVSPTAPNGCPDVLTLFSRHVEGEISADMCEAMERHLAGCPRCRGACDSLKRTLALCRTTAATSEVPPAIRRRVKRALDDFFRDAP